MKVTEIRVKLNNAPQDRLRGFCSITLDSSFVVRDIKIIDGPHGLFVAMPSRKVMGHCPTCRGKNPISAKFCNHCGGRLEEQRPVLSEASRRKLHCDIANPINAACRALVQDSILQAYQEELTRSQSPDYVAPRDEDMDAGDYDAAQH